MKQEHQIYGIRSIIEAIHADRSVQKIFILKGSAGKLFGQLETLAREHSIQMSYVPQEKLHRLAKGKNHQGVVAQISPISYYDMEGLMTHLSSEEPADLLLLLLDGVSDVRNFGAIIRTAACSGVKGIIVPKGGAAPVTADTVKTSSGAVFEMPICKVDHLKDAVFYLQQSDVQVIGATEKCDRKIYDIDFLEPTAIVVGAEDKGISPSLLKTLDDQAKIPIYGSIGSLNVSVATAIVLYEAVRQRNFQLDKLG